ncbi:hypothetical protein [Agromyces sp. Root81]|uniref:hypothetical protein n=1 Tax=Agromyces sp. Root81 TaxID=1736601 RepID=UPI0012FBFA04|nr:hypothetical protein [Agromyces sp. Root81]
MAAIVVPVLLVFAGCAQLPPFDTARDEARGEMQEIVDLLPEDAVDHIEDPIPAGFVSCAGGTKYTGRWLVYLKEPGDAEAAVEGLRRDAAAAGFVEDELLDNRDDRFGSRRGGDEEAPLVGVSFDEDVDDVPYVEIMVFARCSQAPEGIE